MSAFAGMIGHTRIQEVLSRMIEHETLPHALLFVGSEGLGKTTLTHALVKTILSYKGDLHAHPDYLELIRLTDEKTGKRKSLISVKQVRELNTRMGLSGLSGGYKIVFIEDADYLSLGAVNALLKTLEEPKGKTIFLLRATSVDRLPATIVSRCQTLRFSSVPKEEIKKGLVKMGLSPVDAQISAVQAIGRPGRAIRHIKESAYRSEHDTSFEQALSFFSSSLPERFGQVVHLVPKTELQKDEALSATLDQWELVCRDVLFRHLGLTDLCVFADDRLNNLMKTLSVATLLTILDRMTQVRSAVKYHINAHLALEHVALGF